MNTRMMQAATLVGPRRFEVIEVAVPEPNEDEIRVRLELTPLHVGRISLGLALL